MAKFEKLLKEVAGEKAKGAEKANEKMPATQAPKKEKKVSMNELKGNKEAGKILDMAFMLKSAKKAFGEDLNEREKGMFESALSEKAGTTVADLDAVIPSGFTGSFIEDMYAMTNLQGIFGMESIQNFGMTDAIGDFGMTAYVADELKEVTSTNDVQFDFEYRGKKLMARSEMSYEALQDASIDMLTRKRMGLMQALAVGLEQAVLNGQAGDDGVAAGDARTLFRGIRKFGKDKETVDFGGTALTEADWRKYILQMIEAGGIYTSWEEIQAGNVILVVPTKVYNAFIDFDTFVDASKAGMNSTLASGRQVSTVFGVPVVSNRFFPAAVDAAGVVSDIPEDNKLQSIILVNVATCKMYNVAGSALMETDKNISLQKHELVASNRVGFSSIYDQKSSDPTAIDDTRKNIVAGININV